MMKMIKFMQSLESSDKFRVNLLYEVYSSIHQQKDHFISFSIVFLHKNILYTY